MTLPNRLLVGALALGLAPAALSQRPHADDATAASGHGASPHHASSGPMDNQDWWPNQIDLSILHANSAKSDPLGAEFDYAEAFAAVDLDELKADVRTAMTTSQAWWPGDWGSYIGLFIRMAWHSAGTYRVQDGRGGASDGTQRFAPLNSWPDNANLDKARRLLWPVKQKYGQSVSWADLMVLAGNVALETAGFETLGFGGGRADGGEPQTDVFWGPEGKWLDDERYQAERELMNPLAAVQMGLIYVNPEGPNGVPDPLAAAHDIRETFARMAMDDEETVALIAGGHTLGKMHGRGRPDQVGPEPEGAPLEAQGLGWKSGHGSGMGADTMTSGLEGAWTKTPDKWSQGFLENLYEYEWELTKSPAGAHQWTPVDGRANVPDAHIAGQYNKPVMLTTDLALKLDPAYGKISRRFYENPDEFNAAFARAWYKLTHRDMGPVSRLVGAEVAAPQLWQDPVPAVDHPLVDDADVSVLEGRIADAGLAPADLVSTAWVAAAAYRDSDKRGGVNGARIRLAPQNGWAFTEPDRTQGVIAQLERIREDFNGSLGGGKKISLADTIVVAGNLGVELAAKAAGQELSLAFRPGRTDATAEMTDVAGMEPLELKSDGFRNYHSEASWHRPAEALVDRANLLSLTAPEMTVLVGGLRALDANHGGARHGVLTQRPGQLTNDFFVNLLSMDYEWRPVGDDVFEGVRRGTDEVVFTGTSVDLIFGSHSQLRALAEVYASADADRKFVDDFAAAWTKVMELDRFDLAR